MLIKLTIRAMGAMQANTNEAQTDGVFNHPSSLIPTLPNPGGVVFLDDEPLKLPQTRRKTALPVTLTSRCGCTIYLDLSSDGNIG